MMILLADSLASQKSKQNLVTPPTIQRDIKKRVPSSSINKNYHPSTTGRGMKEVPVMVGCVASWQPQGPQELLVSACLV